MEVLKVWLKWLRAGIQDGQMLLWAGLGLFTAYESMISVWRFDPKDVSALAILTLGFLAMGESSIQCANWVLLQGDRSDKADYLRWKSWGRPIIVVNLAMFWALTLQFDKKAPLNAVLITLALGAFGLAKTIPGIKVSGRFANTVLLLSIAVPMLVLAGIGRLIGL